MKNIVICFGCDEYVYLKPLGGAVGDAKNVYSLLTESALYDSGDSKLLLSPTVQQARDALDHLARQSELGVVTLYFAGHSGMKAGTYYLCFKDSDVSRLSTTGLPISSFFAVIGEVRPRQVNFIFDACQSAGAMFDLPALAKTEVIGKADSCSIAFLAASATDQYASETSDGGIATGSLVQYLNGTKQLQTNRQYLDLVEVGLAVSRDVSDQASEQNPTAWGLNLYGDGVFAINPHFFGATAGSGFPVDGITPSSAAGLSIQRHREFLWQEYRLLTTDHQPSRMRSGVTAIRSELGEEFPQFIQGFATTLAVRAEEADDRLAGSDALGVCAVSLLPQLSNPTAARICHTILVRRAKLDAVVCAQLLRALQDDKFSLLSPHALSDFHYLPIRISKLLAWASLGTIGSMRFLPRALPLQASADVFDAILEHYSGSIVTVSDEQAPWAYLLGLSSDIPGWKEKFATVIHRLLESFIATKKVLRVGASGDRAFNYTLARAGANVGLPLEDSANPTELLSVLLLCAHHLGMAAQFDRHLIAVDGTNVNAFVPDDYTRFGDEVIAGGHNYTKRLGHDFWSVDEYGAAFGTSAAPHAARASTTLSADAKYLCALAAYLYPDRVPYFWSLETSEIHQQTQPNG